MSNKIFDDVYFDDGVLILWKSMGEGSGFTIKIGMDATELWETTMYGCNNYLYKSWDYYAADDAYEIGMTFT